MTDNLLKSQAFKLKGRLYTFTVLQLLSNNLKEFAEQLNEIIAQAPRFFDKTPIVLDCTALTENDFDLQAYCQLMRDKNLVPIAVQGANAAKMANAQSLGLGILNASDAQDRPLADVQVDTFIQTTPSKTKILTSPVRSGQQVVAKGGDLIVIASVSHGAELLADGNIHVYGPLRGRALAGISGDAEARIFCHSLEAELIAIAGFYRLSDAFAPQQGPCQIYLQDEHICIEPL